ncbi:hypothetical protein Rhe02_10260 [Rhizocola hellebori]|uniref:Uncharacterized protein n=1 Tax=Rhizocola hellebori TaxID=1392758 RepID=A0A8J3Q3V3_9ACTN|nr:hypothetical protein [Rhizocola hellebori]GIH02959.1 hypothetical protein Rhe02_10260 [Rhizocola hellebori]
MNVVRLAPGCADRDLLVSQVYRLSGAVGDCEVGAILPDASTRRPVEHGDRESYRATTATPSPALVEVIRPPAPMLNAATHHHRGQSTAKGRRRARESLAGAALDHGAEFLFAHSSPADGLTSTVYPGTTLRPGLHVDNRDNKPLRTRLRSRRRMGLNLGPGSRWLLVCFPDILTIAQTLGRDQDRVPGNDEFGEFVDSRRHDVTCVWIPVQPGEAYVAPTDLVGHDGGTLGSQESTIYFFLGSWARAA